jgi:hypothetical protein
VEHEICAHSGARPSEHCPERKREVFAKGQPPLDGSQDWYQMVQIDTFTGLRANEFCPDRVVEKLMLDISNERGREWVQAHPQQFDGLPLAPLEACTDATGRPEVYVTEPAAGAIVHGVVPLIGTVVLPNFDHFEAQYGIGGDPQGWGWISGPHLAQVRDGVLTRWDTSHLAPGRYTVRVRAFDNQQRAVEARVQMWVAAPTATPTPLPSPTPLVTSTPWPTSTPTAGITPTATATWPVTQTPTPTPMAGPTMSPTPGATPTPSPTSETTGSGDQTPEPTP